MDIVITYVNGNDPVWQADYQKYTNTPILQKRFRDWGTLHYLLRGIEKYMPFVRNVYLVVSHPSQVPSWANVENLKIVLHKDIIPSEFLHVFNCNPIEMNLHRIEGLDEEFIYFNDDIFPVAPCGPADFFRKGRPVIGYSRHLFSFNMFKKICRNSDRLARKIAGKGSSCCFTRPQHVCAPLLRSECEKVYVQANDQIRNTCAARTRTENDLNWYLFMDYMNYKGMVIREKISKKHFSVSMASPKQLNEFLHNPTHKLVCINDVHLSDLRYEKLHDAIIEAFESVLPDKCKYEL